MTLTASPTEIGLVRFLDVNAISPSPENDRLYRPIDLGDSDIQALAESIGEIGIKEPLLVSEDGWILSGHRRHAAAKLAGLDAVPCRVEPIRRDDEPDRFMTLLRECNRQRVKTLDEALREEVVSADPTEAHRALVEYRREKARVDVVELAVGERKERKRISKAKRPMLEAALRVIDERRKFWPLSDRGIHYALLNDPPLRHASKAGSLYVNDRKSYHDLCDLLTRARLTGDVPMAAIDDATRPITTWEVWHSAQDFIRDEVGDLFRGYFRDLMASQPNHIEILGEKITVESMIRPVAMEFTIPYTIGRGYSSIPPRRDMLRRFQQSGKERLVLLILSDFDADGQEIAASFARSMRDDFAISESRIVPAKVALTAEQVKRYDLPPGMEAKKSSSRYGKFAAKHGEHVWELEALPPETLQAELRTAIANVIDLDLYNAELAAEHADAAMMEGYRRRACWALGDLLDEEVEL